MEFKNSLDYMVRFILSWNPHAKDPSSKEWRPRVACVPSTAARSFWLKEGLSTGFKISLPDIPTTIALSKQSVTWHLRDVLASSTMSQQTVNAKFGSICKDTIQSGLPNLNLNYLMSSNLLGFVNYDSNEYLYIILWIIYLSRRMLCNDWSLNAF